MNSVIEMVDRWLGKAQLWVRKQHNTHMEWIPEPEDENSLRIKTLKVITALDTLDRFGPTVGVRGGIQPYMTYNEPK